MSWPTITLGDAVVFKGGGTPSRTNPKFWGGSIPWATVKDLNSGYSLTSTKEYITQEGLNSSASNLIPSGTIIIPTRMALGKAVISRTELAINQDLKAVFPRKDIEPRFLLWYFISQRAQIEALGKGATVKGVTLDQLHRLEMPFPPIREQRRIADILDKADKLRIQRAESLIRLEQLQLANFLEMFGDPVINPNGWPTGQIGDLLESAKYGTSAKAGKVGDVPVLRMCNITYAGEMDLTDLKYIDISDSDFDKFTVKPGDILFNRTNSKELVGKTAVYNGPTPMAYAGYLVRGRTKADCSPEYISAYLNSPWGKKKLQSMCKSIVGMANINAREFSAIPIVIPPKELQRRFQRSVAAIQRHKKTLVAQKAVIETLFSAIQQRGFSGKL